MAVTGVGPAENSKVYRRLLPGCPRRPNPQRAIRRAAPRPLISRAGAGLDPDSECQDRPYWRVRRRVPSAEMPSFPISLVNAFFELLLKVGRQADARLFAVPKFNDCPEE